jgi:hypothetical protein
MTVPAIQKREIDAVVVFRASRLRAPAAEPGGAGDPIGRTVLEPRRAGNKDKGNGGGGGRARATAEDC